MSFSGMPFDDVRSVLEQIEALDQDAGSAMARAFARAGHAGNALGRLKDLGVWLAATRGRTPPLIGKTGVALYASTHGFSENAAVALAEQQARVDAVASGAAPVSHLCVANDLSLNVFELALDMPCDDARRAASLDERSCAATIAFGMEATAEGVDLLSIGALGKEAPIAGASILCALFDGGFEHLERDARAVVEAVHTFHGARLGEPLEILRCLGGRDIAALVGAILAGRVQGIPVILDGLPALAACGVLHALKPEATAHCMLAGAGTEMERWVAEKLDLVALVDLRLSQEPGCAGALAAAVVKSAAALAGGVFEVAERQSAL
ncbi:nicotinate-nucleotide--dimethylbenzimidazole phosphoribosyltransferase [Nitratireductor sp. GISD-1A_MAKvit]|uniref:nicotinate-nucleotide--dimethylbenzimidazole phosphoribosyltransferase n=1 Tax=Nitratireductor sp. GISD-1A_MAKvit TaxID=3234198 RepID=UPI0034653A1B